MTATEPNAHWLGMQLAQIWVLR